MPKIYKIRQQFLKEKLNQVEESKAEGKQQ